MINADWAGHVSGLAAISTTGDVMPPYFILESEKLTANGIHIMDELKKNGYGRSDMIYCMGGKNSRGTMLKGTMTKEIWKRYFEKVFIPNLAEAKFPALVIVDGYDANFDLDFLLMCNSKRITVVQEPAHCLSVLQALDQCCFSVLMESWRATMAE